VIQAIMLDTERDLAALVYDDHQDPDAVLRGFAAELNAEGCRVVGMVQAGQCADSSLSAVLIHSGETLLLAQDYDPNASGCRLDIDRLRSAGAQVADALDAGADLLIINRFGKRERDGNGLGYLIERALDAGTPVVIAVSSHRLADWTTFAGETKRLACENSALNAWWRIVSARPSPSGSDFELRQNVENDRR
jgi:nucleoside-triphosphatase THEP1